MADGLPAMTIAHLPEGGPPPKLLDRVRTAVRLRHYSRRTEKAYVDWIRRYILFHQKQHPSTMGASELVAFLSWLAVDKQVSASTQNQRHGRPTRGVYGARVKEVDFDRHQIMVRRGKGQKDRVTMLPAGVKERLAAHLVTVKRQHERDLKRGEGRVVLPFALDRKYPGAPTEWGWQFLFPASRICRDPKWGPPSRFHLHESAVQRAVTESVRQAGVTKHASCHSLRQTAAGVIVSGRW